MSEKLKKKNLNVNRNMNEKSLGQPSSVVLDVFIYHGCRFISLMSVFRRERTPELSPGSAIGPSHSNDNL